MLKVEIPRLHVSILEVVVDTLRRESRRTGNIDRIIQAHIPAEGERNAERRITGCRRNDARHRLIDVDAVSGSQHGLIATERLPHNTNAWLKRWIVTINLIQIRPDAS